METLKKFDKEGEAYDPNRVVIDWAFAGIDASAANQANKLFPDNKSADKMLDTLRCDALDLISGTLDPEKVAEYARLGVKRKINILTEVKEERNFLENLAESVIKDYSLSELPSIQNFRKTVDRDYENFPSEPE